MAFVLLLFVSHFPSVGASGKLRFVIVTFSGYLSLLIHFSLYNVTTPIQIYRNFH